MIGGIVAIPVPAAAKVPTMIGGDELAHGLLLIRSSAISLARLHVAIERQDRRLVLETMDDLAALDRRIEKLVEEIPTSDNEVALLQARLVEQKMTLASEKLAFGAGIRRKEQRPPSTGLPLDVNAEQEEALAVEGPALPPAAALAEDAVSEEWVATEEEADERIWPRLFAVTCLLIIAVSLAAGTFTSAGRELLRAALIAAGA